MRFGHFVVLGSAVLLANSAFAESESAVGAYRKATWVFQCPSDRVTLPAAARNELVLEDAGPFAQYREKLTNTPFTISGKLCPAERLARDAVFVVDVSGSMGVNDPYIPDAANPGHYTCGRLEALRALLDKMPAATSSFGIALFSDDVEGASTQMFTDRQALLADIAQGGDIEDQICQYLGGTYYAEGLSAAKTLLATSRLDATKEIYFLTDGAPTDASDAERVATDLRTNGVTIGTEARPVTIATIMLGRTSDTFLRDKIASKDAAGLPYHVVANNAGDLAGALDTLADSQLAGAHILHGADPLVGTLAEIDVMPFFDAATNKFQLPDMPLSIDSRQTGYVMTFEYWDTNGHRFTVNGKLDWQ